LSSTYITELKTPGKVMRFDEWQTKKKHNFYKLQLVKQLTGQQKYINPLSAVILKNSAFYYTVCVLMGFV
jgi:hypothetical protein